MENNKKWLFGTNLMCELEHDGFYSEVLFLNLLLTLVQVGAIPTNNDLSEDKLTAHLGFLLTAPNLEENKEACKVLDQLFDRVKSLGHKYLANLPLPKD
jgi:hypothetical protein